MLTSFYNLNEYLNVNNLSYFFYKKLNFYSILLPIVQLHNATNLIY